MILEIFGWIGSGLIVLSLAQARVWRFRIMNFVGAVIAELWTRFNKRTAERFVVPLASGAVAGESLAAAAYAILANLGVFGH